MSVKLAQETDYWFGLLPEDAKPLGGGWQYIQSRNELLRAICSDGIGRIFYAHPYKGIVGLTEQTKQEP